MNYVPFDLPVISMDPVSVTTWYYSLSLPPFSVIIAMTYAIVVHVTPGTTSPLVAFCNSIMPLPCNQICTVLEATGSMLIANMYA